MSEVIVPFRCIAKVLRVPVFRLALGNDLVFRVIILFHQCFSRICQGKNRFFRTFDPRIAQRSVDRFKALGAQIHFVTPRDGKGKIQMMTFKAQDLEQRIRALGGSWEPRSLLGRKVLAIVPPKQNSAQWLEFKEKLSHFRWQEEEGMLITCDCADVIALDAQRRCFLYAHSTSSSFASDWARSGFYLGAKQDLCFFDNGNTWKNQGRPPSEESFYLEIEAVYEKIKKSYPVDCLWVGGSCGGAPVAAYLKRVLHKQGVNFFAEQSFTNLDDFVKPISSFFAPRIKGCLNDPVAPTNRHNRPAACQFGVDKLWKDLPSTSKGKIVIVQVREDEHISEAAYKRYLQLASRVNCKVKHILYSSTAKWRHADDFFHYKSCRREFMQSVFSSG